MRWLAALAIAIAALVVAHALPVRAADPADCQPKDAHIALVTQKHPKAITTDLAGPLEEIFLKNLSNLFGRDLTGLDAVISRHPGFRSTLVAVFHRGGCMLGVEQLPNPVVSQLLGGPEA